MLPTPIEILSAIFATTFNVGERFAKSSNPKKIAAAPKPHSISPLGHISCLNCISSVLKLLFLFTCQRSEQAHDDDGGNEMHHDHAPENGNGYPRSREQTDQGHNGTQKRDAQHNER